MRLDDLRAVILEAHDKAVPLRIRGGGSKDFYGGMLAGDIFNVADFRGIVAYEPSELYITARCGTPLAEIEATLAGKGQMLAFEPPHFAGATVGGCVASGLAGPRRPHSGAVRDFVLGAKIVDGNGQVLSFGGQVMKNVAGYDVSRLLAGSFGTLGLIAEVSLKVLPRPLAEATLRFYMDEDEVIERLNAWAMQPLPISASFWADGQLSLRLSGAVAAVDAAARKLGGERVEAADLYWQSVREQTHPAFSGAPLWRLSLPSIATALALDGLCAIEWGGGQRWYAGEFDAAVVREVARQAGGHAVLYRAPESLRCLEGAFAPLAPGLLALHRRVKKVFDPRGILNPGRLYAEL